MQGLMDSAANLTSSCESRRGEYRDERKEKNTYRVELLRIKRSHLPSSLVLTDLRLLGLVSQANGLLESVCLAADAGMERGLVDHLHILHVHSTGGDEGGNRNGDTDGGGSEALDGGGDGGRAGGDVSTLLGTTVRLDLGRDRVFGELHLLLEGTMAGLGLGWLTVKVHFDGAEGGTTTPRARRVDVQRGIVGVGAET